MDKPGTPGSKGRSTTPNAAGGPQNAKNPIPPVQGYPNSPYQRPQPDPYQRPPPDAAYGRLPFDPHAHVRTNGIPLAGPIAGGKP